MTQFNMNTELGGKIFEILLVMDKGNERGTHKFIYELIHVVTFLMYCDGPQNSLSVELLFFFFLAARLLLQFHG